MIYLRSESKLYSSVCRDRESWLCGICLWGQWCQL